MSSVWIDIVNDKFSLHDVFKVDGHDNAIIGIVNSPGIDGLHFVYSRSTIIDNCQKMGMSYHEAREYYDFNIVNAFGGVGAPEFYDEDYDGEEEG